MRLRSLIAAAAAAVPLLAPTVASARKHASTTGCSINITVAPRLIEAGETALVFGRLRCPRKDGNAAAGKTVRLMQVVTGVGEFPVAATTSAHSRGFYELAR